MARPAQPAPALTPERADALLQRYATERRRQLLVLWVVAAVVLVASVVAAGVQNVFLPGWWRVDLP